MACEFKLAQVLEATGGVLLSEVAKEFIGVGTDTRKDLSDQIFFALKGDAFDAHEFLEAAAQKGAKLLIIHNDNLPSVAKLRGQVTVIKVSDTLRALQDLARYWRKKLKGKVFGITGSNGKTSTKEFTGAILGAEFKVHFSHGSFNNHWGVPLTLLEADIDDEAVIVEMGMNHEDELTQLSKIALPDVVVCTTVGRAHVGNFAGSQQKVADAKEEIYLANPKAFKIFNYDNEFTLKMFERVSKLLGTEKTIVFSAFSAGAEVSFRAEKMTFSGLSVTGHIRGVKGQALVPVFGRHNVVNLMAAASMALVMGMEPEKIWQAITLCRGQWGRNQIVKIKDGPTVLFDAYNANPDSSAMLIKNIYEMSIEDGGRKVAVLAEMLELGDEAAHYHHEFGELVGQTDFSLVWFYGADSAAFEAGLKQSGFDKTYFVSNTYEDSLAMKLRSMLNPSDVVVMKGSRGMRLERVLQAWDRSFQLQK